MCLLSIRISTGSDIIIYSISYSKSQGSLTWLPIQHIHLIVSGTLAHVHHGGQEA